MCFMTIVPLILTSCAGNSTPQSTGVPPSTETQTAPQTMQNIDCVFETVSPADIASEVLSFSGNTAGKQQFTLTATTNLRVYWTQSTQDNFDLSILNQDPALANSIEKTTTLESYVGPSSGCVDASLNAGNYQINVNENAGSWKVWVETINYK